MQASAEERALLSQIVPLTLQHVVREYPHGAFCHWHSAADAPPDRPALRHPAFYGCYDWHSAVHAHWQLVRAVRRWPDAPFADVVVAHLDAHLAPAPLRAELEFALARPGFELPYGMAWVLQLAAEVRSVPAEPFGRWAAALALLERHAAARIAAWLIRLPRPVRSGTHHQTAFAMGLAWDWARTAGDAAMLELLAHHARRFFLADQAAPLAYEPSAGDFLSPALAEADLLRRVLSRAGFSEWLWAFFGDAQCDGLVEALAPVRVVDPGDGQLAHFAGLNLSRAWMLESIAGALPDDDPRVAPLRRLAADHHRIGMPEALHADYMVSHWAPSFALYLVSRRGAQPG